MGKTQPQKTEFVRISLTIPATLKEELDKYAANENWSAWATECFRLRLLGIKSKQRMGRDMKNIIERLRGTAMLEEVTDYDRGNAAGRKWAENQATAGQLLRLAAFCPRAFGPKRSAGTRRGWPGRLYEVMYGERSSEKEIMQFWESSVEKSDVPFLFEPDLNEGPTEFMRGFVDGALELWKTVKDQL
jgi:hypothetical protein